MDIRTEEASTGRLSGLRIGYIVYDSIHVAKASATVDALVEAALNDARARFPGTDSISKDPVIRGIRRLFSNAGTDPTKERPSGEALIRRVVSGQGLCRINCVVDANNAISIMSGCPCGVYDLGRIKGGIVVAVGKEGDSYEGIGGRTVNACGRLVTRDEESIFGAPTADSKRTCVGPETKNLLMLIYHFDAPPESLASAMEHAKKAMESATGGRRSESGIYEVR